MPLRWERWHEHGEHAIAGREFDERLTTLRESLVIAAEPTPAHYPGETALNDPTLGLRSKAFRKQGIPVHFLPFGHKQPAFGKGERMDRLYDPAQLLFYPSQKCPAIMTVTPKKLHPGKHLLHWRKQGSASLLIGTLSSQNFDGQQVALRIHQRVAFATPDFFSPYHSPFPGHVLHSF